MRSIGIYNKLVDHFISTGDLGHYDRESFSIMLYGIKNDDQALYKIKSDIERFTKKYKLIILDKKSDFTNVNILDIEL